MKRHVLDANALYRFLMEQPGAEVVERLFLRARDSGTTLLMSVVNWGEVYYALAVRKSFKEAQLVMAQVRLLPLKIVIADEAITESAAQLKSGYKLPYADCFAAAVAGRSSVLVTADVKDFKKVAWLQLLSLPPHRP